MASTRWPGPPQRRRGWGADVSGTGQAGPPKQRIGVEPRNGALAWRKRGKIMAIALEPEKDAGPVINLSCGALASAGGRAHHPWPGNGRR
ncbi:hypothetical protein BOSE62_120009 [Bosea sp. 62]|nr:hypothetical protein BOSE7B_100009 [Bosea sp. 7B]CAD5283160.1 hypothetical protein BOSE21B_40058 [Bosea sp. 21B]CAD5285840.1 hypothetical protein BOSE46_60056 [Bosea sp. 46]VVT62328.1 hypothetical protein BOS5A_40058 [Bosea sp. EC-HK365B]VXB18691.1 hypothetical protein BOSE62_120009 [Bosea sp. 62]VXB79958.1 hypothetical protein BOSE127_150009 [Bosea sp. 127]VXC51163.1 hypothetical protein BOSE29B_40171 [Bosea sp. 29B]VXC87457.1 hypothetical protein BOSE125_70056 [Bosea sp. 125]